MHDLIIIGAGPGGIALAAEARAAGIDPSRTMILEKGTTHNWAIRQLYPEQKLTTANYKGFQVRCEGLLCTKYCGLPSARVQSAGYGILSQYSTIPGLKVVGLFLPRAF
jgi:hypothetical protein